MNNSPHRDGSSLAFAGESLERTSEFANDPGADELGIKVHRFRIDGADPLALFVELLRRL